MLLIVMLSLATYRVGRFILLDKLIDVPRIRVHGFLLGKTSWWRSKLYDLITCPYCITVWLSAGMVVVADFTMSVPSPFLTWLAVAGGCLIPWNYIED